MSSSSCPTTLTGERDDAAASAMASGGGDRGGSDRRRPTLRCGHTHAQSLREALRARVLAGVMRDRFIYQEDRLTTNNFPTKGGLAQSAECAVSRPGFSN